jgi:hypothetical protein
LNTGHVLWLSFALLATVDSQVLAEYIRRCGQVKDHREIEGAIFDNTGDVDLFVDRLEKKYIVYLLKK